MNTEIAIIGGGYAGLAAAIAAAKRGAEVTLFERYDSIGKISRCGGGTWWSEIDDSYGLKEFAHPIRRVAFISSHQASEHHAPDATLCVIDTRGFLKRLASIAEKSGARILCSHNVKSLIRKRKKTVGIVVEHDGKITEVKSDMTIDCSGVARCHGNKLSPDQKAFGLEVEIDKQIEPDLGKLVVGSEAAPSGYAWIFPCPYGRTRVGVGFISPKYWRLGEPFLKYAFEHFLEGVRNYRIVERKGGFVPCHYPLKKIVFDGLALAGDSAGQLSLLTGEGTRYALKWGAMAGEYCVKLCASSHTGKDEPDGLPEEWRKFRKELIMQYLMNRIMRNMSNAQWDYYVSKLPQASTESFVKLIKGEMTLKYALARFRAKFGGGKSLPPDSK